MNMRERESESESERERAHRVKREGWNEGKVEGLKEE